MERKTAWEKYTRKQKTDVMTFAEGYRQFISDCKTERECVKEFVKIASNQGFKDLSKLIEKKGKLKAGDKVYLTNMGKAMVLFVIGKEPLEKGMNILGAHIDSPRLDLKHNPLYEDSGLAMMDTHYYGGIKKYQWVTLPMALHGVIATKEKGVIEINIGEKELDPVFGVSDLLIHLAADQMDKKVAKAVKGEALDICVGSIPLKGEEKDAVKKNVLKILKDKYGIVEEDFISAEIEVVPAGSARDYGFDRSMIMGYGQDDRVCAYTSLIAMVEGASEGRTSCCILADKEEIGSTGATGMNSHLLDNAVAEVVARLNVKDNPELVIRRALANSYMLSSDVNTAYDPLNSNLYDSDNSSFLGRGVVFNKYTGSRGKSGASDANPEFIAKVRAKLYEKDVKFQNAELAKVDVGGGGTIAHYAAEYGMSVLDCGVSVLSMHAPWEITSAYDIEQAYLCYKAFLTLA